MTALTPDLEQALADLRAARQHALNVLVLCSGYVDVRAAEGDPRAQDLARLVASAHDRLTATDINAVTIREQHASRGIAGD